MKNNSQKNTTPKSNLPKLPKGYHVIDLKTFKKLFNLQKPVVIGWKQENDSNWYIINSIETPMTKSEVELLHEEIFNLTNVINNKFEKVEKRIDQVNTKIDDLHTEMDNKFKEVDKRLDYVYQVLEDNNLKLKSKKL